MKKNKECDEALERRHSTTKRLKRKKENSQSHESRGEEIQQKQIGNVERGVSYTEPSKATWISATKFVLHVESERMVT